MGFINSILSNIRKIWLKIRTGDNHVWLYRGEFEAIMKEKIELESKVKLWYNMYHGENFAKFFGIVPIQKVELLSNSTKNEE